MKTHVPVFAVILACPPVACLAATAPLTTLHSIAALTNADATRHTPVSFEATVTYFDAKTRNLDVQENSEAIYVRTPMGAQLLPGDRVLIRGTMQPSFLPYVVGTDVTVLRHGVLPAPLPATYEDLVHKQINCRYVSVRGVIRTADLVSSPGTPTGRLQMLMDGGYIDVEVESYDVIGLKNLLDAHVEVVGATGRKFDSKMQQVGAKVKVSSIADIRVIKKSGAGPWSMPLTPLQDIVMGTHVRDLSQRLRIRGTITYYQPGSAVVIENSTTSLWISTQTSEPLRIGDVADATGFPDTDDGRLTLAHAEVRDSQLMAPIQPLAATWSQLAFFERSKLGGHEFDLVSIDGRVVSAIREAMQDEFVLLADGREFTAIYRHPPPPIPLPPMLKVPVGATIQVTGICLPQAADPSNNEVPFNILLRSFDDVQIVAKPSLLTVRNVTIVAIFLLFFAMVAGIRSWILERRVRRQTANLAYLERRRRRILEDINGARPLAEIVEQITELVSFRLKGAPCWCQIADGARLGNCPTDLSAFRVRSNEIPARSGAPLGTIFSAFDVLSKPSIEHDDAIAMGAGLAALAIATRRLYSDLIHRSEFDLLTDIQNRFSMEKHLDALIDDARRTAGVFGLIYIDLDKFKLVNDRYGHHVGDMYLREAASRMKRQLRPGDILARLGGDEFAVLVPVVRTRAGVQEIAVRLERCFDEPFAADGNVILGSASVGIALYPEDAATSDAMLRFADADMYVAKHARAAIAVA